jgi:hypothetical protein
MELTQEQRDVLTELNISVPTGVFPECMAERITLAANALSVLAVTTTTLKLVFEPDPTTLSKWAAMAAAAVLVAALANLILAYDKLIKCEEATVTGEADKREIEELKRRQAQLETTLEKLKREMAK